MQKLPTSTTNILLVFGCILVLLGVLSLSPLSPSWGSYEMKTTPTITVMGTAQGQVNNQIAVINTGIDAIESSKEGAMSKVTEQMNSVIEQIKALGIDEADVKTTSINVYQEDEGYRTDGRYEVEKGDWHAENQITFTVRQLDQVSQVLNILNNSTVNSISGPNYQVDDSQADEDALFAEAVGNARKKAESIAAANGQHIKGILNLYEESSNSVMPMYEAAMGKSVMMDSTIAVPSVESGSSQLEKTVMVTFELR